MLPPGDWKSPLTKKKVPPLSKQRGGQKPFPSVREREEKSRKGVLPGATNKSPEDLEKFAQDLQGGNPNVSGKEARNIPGGRRQQKKPKGKK